MCVMRSVTYFRAYHTTTREKINPGRIASTKIVILDSTDIQETAPTQNCLFAAYPIALEIPAATVASASQTKVP